MLIFARHGNTFEDFETPRMVGAGEDLPLTSKGREQARELGRALGSAGIGLMSVLAGPLKRTMEFAQIAAESAGFAGGVVEDRRLRELDFGTWSGLTDVQIAARFGETALNGWRLQGRQPTGCNWNPAETAIRNDLASLLEEVSNSSLCITSNGILRYIMEVDIDAFASRGPNGGFRVKTGNLCVFEREAGRLRLLAWNERPDARVLASIAAKSRTTSGDE